MDEGAKRWLYKESRKQHWRVASWMGIDDLIQDGFYYYERVRQRYPEIDSPAHLMAIFKSSFLNHVHDLSIKRTKEAAAIEQYAPRVADLHQPETSTFQALCSQAPQPVQDLFAALSREDGCRSLRSRYKLRRNGSRESMNERLCRIVGVDPKSHDLPAMIRSHFRV